MSETAGTSQTDSASQTDNASQIEGSNHPDGASDATWAELRSAALIGTAKRAFDGNGDTTVSDERRALTTAALLTARRRAGLRPWRSDTLAPVPSARDRTSPTDERQAPAEATPLLDVVLAGTNAGDRDALLDHWLRCCAERGATVPDAALVRLLEFAGRNVELRLAVLGCLGRHGRWLAAQNPDWSWAAVPLELDDAAFTDLERRARTLAFTDLRLRRPAEARDLFVAVAPSLDATDRVQLLETFVHRLDIDDEAVLDAALEDRSTKVRWEAIRLLERLPDAGRSRRLTELVAPHVQLEGRLRPTLRIVLEGLSLAELDLRDWPPRGVDVEAQRRAFALAAVPLDWWTETLGRSAVDLVHGRIEPRDEVVSAWIRAAIAQRDPTWALALFDLDDGDLPAEDRSHRREIRKSLLEVAGDDAADTVGRAVAGVDDWRTKLTVLQQLPRPWAPGVTTGLLHDAGREPEPLLRAIAWFPPSVLPDAALPLLAAFEQRIGSRDRMIAGGLRQALRFLGTRRAITTAFEDAALDDTAFDPGGTP